HTDGIGCMKCIIGRPVGVPVLVMLVGNLETPVSIGVLLGVGGVGMVRGRIGWQPAQIRPEAPSACAVQQFGADQVFGYPRNLIAIEFAAAKPEVAVSIGNAVIKGACAGRG